ncbi:MAG: hypothetical protein ABSE28_17710 [Candidatus Sulfotelmatobacter sp.]|jgi:hypothetical protein
MSPSSRRDGTVAITAAATGVADLGLPTLGGQQIVAVVNSFPEAAGMGLRGGNRERQGRKASHKREQQTQSCGQAMHAFCVNPNPKCG